MQAIRTTTKDCGTQLVFHLAFECNEMADFRTDGGSVTEMGSRLEVPKQRMGND